MGIGEKFIQLIKKYVSTEELQWITLKSENEFREISSAFPDIQNKVSDRSVNVSELYDGFEQSIGFTVEWSLQKLVRVYFLLKTGLDSHESYVRRVSSLFTNLSDKWGSDFYTALPFLSYPDEWNFIAQKALESDSSSSLKALTLGNPYPSGYFSEEEWNGMVILCIEKGININLIPGMEDRANRALARHISTYARQQWEIRRPVNPNIWRLVIRYLNDDLIEDLEVLFRSKNVSEQHAAALVCHEAAFKKAGKLLSFYPVLSVAVKQGALSWENLDQS